MNARLNDRGKHFVLDAAFFRDPYPTYRRLRAAGPLIFTEAFGASGSWLVPRYADVAQALRERSLAARRSQRLFFCA